MILEDIYMTAIQATAEVFLTAFRALTRKEREAFLEKLIEDEKMAEDLRDLLVVESRKAEPVITLDEYLVKRQKR
jgi:uncharacterized membrane protein (DUF106 family)